MKYLALAVFLAVMQAPPSVPRKAADSPAHRGGSVKKNPDSHHSPAPPQSPVTNSAASNENQNPTKVPTDANAKEAIPIREPAPVSIEGKDWWDRAYVIFTGALFIVAAIGLCLAYKSLRAIESQAGIMQGQLKTMGDQVAEMQSAGKQTERILETMGDTAIRELRAYVCISSAHIAFIQERAPEVQVHIKNSGKTPAYDVKMWIGIGHGPYPITGTLPPPPRGFQTSTSLLGPGEEPHAMVRQYPVFPEESMPIIGTPQLTLYIYGKITYRDAFNNERYTQYQFIFGGTEPQVLREENGIGVAFLRADTEGNNAT